MLNSSDKTIDLYNDVSNPLDGIEEIMMNNDWVFSRPFDDQLTVQVSGKMGVYDMVFLWQDDYSAMQFMCMPDVTVTDDKAEQTIKAMHEMNQNLWLGHFDLEKSGNSFRPRFKHTCLFRGMVETSGIEIIEDLIDIALSECERYYTTFNMMSVKEPLNDNLALSMMDVAGRS